MREINREVRECIAAGAREIHVEDPGARHNLAVAVTRPVWLVFEGSVGYYCAGLADGPEVLVRGSAGWGLGECMCGGAIVVEGSAGNGAAASMRGGTVVIHGDAGARAGVSMKGGTLIVGGNAGTMTGFMGQKGAIIICGDAGEALGDSMYETTIYVGGSIADLGNDAVLSAPTSAEVDAVAALLVPHGIDARRDWKKVASGRRLWNFDRTESLWREAL